jgi:hypothetical protein
MKLRPAEKRSTKVPGHIWLPSAGEIDGVPCHRATSTQIAHFKTKSNSSKANITGCCLGNSSTHSGEFPRGLLKGEGSREKHRERGPLCGECIMSELKLRPSKPHFEMETNIAGRYQRKCFNSQRQVTSGAIEGRRLAGKSPREAGAGRQIFMSQLKLRPPKRLTAKPVASGEWLARSNARLRRGQCDAAPVAWNKERSLACAPDDRARERRRER